LSPPSAPLRDADEVQTVGIGRDRVLAEEERLHDQRSSTEAVVAGDGDDAVAVAVVDLEAPELAGDDHDGLVERVAIDAAILAVAKNELAHPERGGLLSLAGHLPDEVRLLAAVVVRGGRLFGAREGGEKEKGKSHGQLLAGVDSTYRSALNVYCG
jgi:hypothetical protein